MRDLVIGLDLGTSSYKAAAFDATGQFVAEAAATPTVHHPRAGWVEQDPANLLSTAALAIRKLTATGIEPTRVRAIGLTGQLGGIVLVDQLGQAIGPHEVWLDNRCQSYREVWLAEHGQEIFSLNGIHPYQGPRLQWRAAERRDEYARAAKAMQCWPFVGATFAGLEAVGAFNDFTSIGLFGVADVAAGAWSPRLCHSTGIDPDYLPRIVAPDEIIGQLTTDWAEQTGLPPGTPIVAGLGDGIAGWLGCGVVESGIAVDTAGSSDHFSVAVDHFATDPEYKVVTAFRSAIPDLWHLFGFTAGSGLSHQWFVREFYRELGDLGAMSPNTWATIEAEAAEIPAGSAQLICLPHLEGRFCPDQPNTRGVWIGFTWSHTRAHFYRSILESIAYEYAHYLAAMRRIGAGDTVREVRVVGGGATSALWNQIKADVLGLEYVQLTPANYTCRGAALCAGVATGLYADFASTAQYRVDVVRRYFPDPNRHRQYQSYVEQYRLLLNDLAPSFARQVRLP